MALDAMVAGGAQIAGEDGRRTVEARLELSAAERAMAGLPQGQQDVLALVCVAGLGYREAAETLDLTLPGDRAERAVVCRQDPDGWAVVAAVAAGQAEAGL